MQSPGVATRSKARMTPSPNHGEWTPSFHGLEKTPKTRRSAQVFGTPLSVCRPALDDVTNETPIAGLAPRMKSGKSASPAGSTKKTMTLPQVEENPPKSEVEESNAEELLRGEVYRMIADLPEEMETPVLVKSKSLASEVTVLVEAEAIKKDTGVSEAVCFSPTTFLAPTPNNTPVGPGAAGQGRRVNAAAVAADLTKIAASITGKPPLPKSLKKKPRKAVLPVLTIATPIGKTPPPHVARRSLEEASFDPAHLLQAITAVQYQDLASPASSPERASRALMFDSPPRSLPSTPYYLKKSAEPNSAVTSISSDDAAASVPGSPAWSLDVNVSTPAVNNQRSMKQQPSSFPTLEEDVELEAENEAANLARSNLVNVWDCSFEEKDEETGEDDVCDAMAHLSMGPSAPLRGMPEPAGSHIRFQD